MSTHSEAARSTGYEFLGRDGIGQELLTALRGLLLALSRAHGHEACETRLKRAARLKPREDGNQAAALMDSVPIVNGQR